MLKDKIQGLAVGLLAGSMLTGGIAFARSGSEMIEVAYNNIKLFINGSEIEPRDSDGNAVEPFIYDGTTYLPVRAVAQALGQDVSWDGDTNSVYIGSGSSASSETTTGGYGITREAFDKIQIGMTYEEVVNIIGFEGSQVSESSDMASYSWKTDKTVWPTIHITTINGEVVSKAQAGLD